MADFDIVFEKLAELTRDGEDTAITVSATVTSSELDEIEELRRFSAEIQEPEPPSFTMT